MKLVKIIYKLRLSDGDKCASEIIFSSGPEMCAKSYMFTSFSLRLSISCWEKCSSYAFTVNMGSRSPSVQHGIQHKINHNSFYSLLIPSTRVNEHIHKNRWKKTKSKNQLEMCAPAAKDTVSQRIRFDNQFHVETDTQTHDVIWSHERIKEICWNVAHAMRGTGKI